MPVGKEFDRYYDEAQQGQKLALMDTDETIQSKLPVENGEVILTQTRLYLATGEREGPLPNVRLERSRFEEHLRTTMEELPDRFREHLDEVAVTVETVPSEEILRLDDPPLDPELLGLFVGTPRTEESVFGGNDLPPRILLFQRNLERNALDEDELKDEIAITLRHELAHYLGLDEEEIEEAGHA